MGAEEIINLDEVDSGFSSEEEELPHVDERWLVSYADMMTLLFGLFVLLYSMADNFELIQKSAEKQFNPNKQMTPSAESAGVTQEPPAIQIAALEREKLELLNRISALESKTSAQSATVAELTAAAEQLEKMKQSMAEQGGLLRQIQILEKERDQLRASLAHKDLPADDVGEVPQQAMPEQGSEAESAPEENARGSGGAAMNLSVRFNVPGGGQVETNTTRVNLAGFQVQDGSQFPPGQKVRVTLTNENGVSFDVMVRATPSGPGQPTRVKILSFPGGNDNILRDWLGTSR